MEKNGNSGLVSIEEWIDKTEYQNKDGSRGQEKWFWLRAFAVLAGDAGVVLSTHIWDVDS